MVLTVLNMHELAVTSGFAAAYRLGADYPFKGDDDCERLFKLYLALSHGVRLVSTRFSLSSMSTIMHTPLQRKEDRKGIFA